MIYIKECFNGISLYSLPFSTFTPKIGTFQSTRKRHSTPRLHSHRPPTSLSAPICRPNASDRTIPYRPPIPLPTPPHACTTNPYPAAPTSSPNLAHTCPLDYSLPASLPTPDRLAPTTTTHLFLAQTDRSQPTQTLAQTKIPSFRRGFKYLLKP